MHDAFKLSAIVEKINSPLKIESIACYDDVLLVGTNNGPLLKFRVSESKNSEGELKQEIALEKTNKLFAKKPVLQLCAVPELFILISLADNVVSVHDLNNWSLISTLSNTKGATLFTTDLQTFPKDGVPTSLKMFVAVKRKIITLLWQNNEFTDLYGELIMYDIPKAMAWYNQRLCIGFRKDYYLVKVETGDIKELFPLGSQQIEPVVTYMNKEGFIVSRDKMSVFIDIDGHLTKKRSLTWTDIPVAVVHEFPYLISILPKVIEVRTIEPQLMIQSIVLQNAKFICQSSGAIYIASSSNVWRLNAVPVTKQIQQLVQNKEFELALQLANVTDDKCQRITTIQTLFAVNLFCKHKFEESMKIFVTLDTDPSNVIGLFPNLLPSEYQKHLDYPEKLPNLDGGDLEKGLLALIDYLNSKRRKLHNDNFVTPSAIKEGNVTIISKEQLAQIIDTTLLKCYLQTNDALVASLLRLPDNKVHVEEAERCLIKKEKFSELIILYEKKGMHDKALGMLMKQAARPNSPLQGCDRTVQYLQHLGPEHLKLIFEYAEWVVKSNPKEGFKIFNEDIPEVESLPRCAVLDYLENLAKNNKEQNIKDLPIKYLEHVIFEWNDVSEEIHNRFAELLRVKVQTYKKDNPQTGGIPTEAVIVSKEIEDYRQKLIKFLETSEHYKPEELLPRFPMNEFFEERAILLGRLGRHEVALGLYVIVLKNIELAEKHCKKYYARNNPVGEDVYFYLLKVYLQPPEPSSLGLSAFKDGPKPEPNVTAALKTMTEHAACIDPTKVLELLPSDTKIQDILAYLENILEFRAASRNKDMILKNILFTEGLNVHQQKIFYEKEMIVISELKSCVVCKKRIGNSFFARYPNGVIVHYGCCKDPKVAPGAT